MVLGRDGKKERDRRQAGPGEKKGKERKKGKMGGRLEKKKKRAVERKFSPMDILGFK